MEILYLAFSDASYVCEIEGLVVGETYLHIELSFPLFSRLM